MEPGRRVALDERAHVWGDGSVVLGGAPWGLLQIAVDARPFIKRLREAGPAGLVPSPGVEDSATAALLRRGVVHPLIPRGAFAGLPGAVDVVVPVYDDAGPLDACLRALRTADPDIRIIVVDDGSSTEQVAVVARSHGATLISHPANRGPAAARNTGWRAATAPIVAFVDADCAVAPGWLDRLAAHFDDPRVAAVGPRIHSRPDTDGTLARYELTNSALDMGTRPDVVAHGGPLGYLPTATLLVRRSCLADAATGVGGFDEDLRLGEDVDLVWRLVSRGWLVRYEPSASVSHRMRPNVRHWARRHFDYGTSAADLDLRHPGRLTPARLSGWNVAVGLLLVLRRPTPTLAAIAAGSVMTLAGARLAGTFHRTSIDPRVAPVVLGMRLLRDAAAVGHLLRREWWPLGWLALAVAPRTRIGRVAAACMLAPLAREWYTRPTDLDPARFIGLHLIEDAAYGTGVIVGAARRRHPRVVWPSVRLPRIGLRRPQKNPAAEVL